MSASRIALALAVVFGIAGALLLLGYRSDQRMIAALADRLDAGATSTPREDLERYVRFAATELRDPSYDQIEPWPVRLYYRFNPLHPGPADVLRWGSDYRGACGSHTRVVVALLEQRGVPCHPLLLLDAGGRSIHTVVEARIDGRWVVADALYGIVYQRRDGSLASAQDLAADTALFHAQTRDARDYDPRYDYDSVTLINWRKVPVIMPAVRSLLVHAIGEESVRELRRPRVWMRPRLFYGSVSLALAGVCLFIGAIAANGRARRTAGARS